MKTVEFLSHLRSLDIQIVVEGDRLSCNAPSGTVTASLRAEIQKRKTEIISFLKTTNYTQIPLVPRPRHNHLPLSFAQQRLWFLDQLVPNNPFYNVPAALRLTGQLNIAALEQTFNEIIRRHEALRTTFVIVSGQPTQTIASSLNLPLSIIDLREVPQVERSAQTQAAIAQEIQRPFNLSTDPLLRVTLLRLNDTEHILLLNMHHIVSDGWSIGVLIREIATIYTSLHVNRASCPDTSLPPLPIQYVDFAYWQRQWLQGEVLEKQLSYWRKQLDGISILHLPTDRPRPALPTYKGARQFLQLSKSLSEALENLSQQSGVTLFMTLLAAFQILLYRYTQQEDIAVGSPIANRNRSEIEGLIGFFVNSLVLRANLSENPTFNSLLKQVREVTLAAYAHQDLPFEKLVEELHPERNLNQNPLFQVVFALQNAPIPVLELPELTLTPLQFDYQTTRFDLEFHLWERSPQNSLWVNSSEGISGFAIYNTDLFDDATISRMLGHFQVLLENIVADPEQPVANLPLLTEAERHQLLVECHNTQVDYPQNKCVHQLFEEQVKLNNNAIAISFAGKQLSYQELNTRSNKLAHYLKKQGVGAEVLVGLCVERSLDMLIGMLAILKAGGVYVPLDPAYPKERLKLILSDTQLPILLTHSLTAPLLEGDRSIIYLDRQWEAIAQEIEDNPTNSITANNLAYIIYTSGSTGKPKGVQIEHRALLNLIFWHQKAFAISPHDRATQIAGVAFDASIWEILPYLSAGASVHFPDEETRRSPQQLQNWLISNAISISFVPTPLCEKLLSLDWSNNTSLRILLTGGDKLYQYPLKQYPFRLINNYGPTENTVVTTSGEVGVKNPTGIAPTVGRPIANTRVYILDRNLQPVPVGVAGELYIAGDGLARGYLNDSELTKASFLEKDELLYKTGDLVRYLQDGNIEFLNRVDSQVKIRGHRIELGEIETVLNQHPSVQQAIAIAFEDAGEKNLVAYVVLNGEFSRLKDNKEQQDERILEWQRVYDETYKQVGDGSDPTFNIVGWNSSYTKQPIPAEQMREWVDSQVAQILAFHPRRVLEIGCGTGLLLFRIVPYCSKYLGTDFSQGSLDYVWGYVPDETRHVTSLQQKMATDFEGIEPQSFDTVIVNSVVQYFPSIDYFLQVLDGAVQVTRPGGFIFIGDLRSLPLLQAFHASVQLYQAEPELTREQLQQRVEMQVFHETELVIDPALFNALKQRFPQICDVKIQLLRGRDRNELTQFRYNAILCIGDPPLQFVKERTEYLDWRENNFTVATVRQLLIENQPEILAIANIPNARVVEAVKTAQWLTDAENFKTVSQIRSALQRLENLGVDPEDLYALADEQPYNIEISWSDYNTEGSYNAVFVRKNAARNIFPPSTPHRPWESYANNPLQAKTARQVIPQLRNYLAEKLPEYMIPSAFVVVESLPLTPNGKVNRRALPTPKEIKAESVGSYVAPQTPIEKALVKIFTDVLGLKQVGIQDNFFELGGHSLLATQLVSRVRDVCQVELPLRSVFEAPTVDSLSKVVESLKDSNTQTKTPALVPLDRETRRMKLSSLKKEEQ